MSGGFADLRARTLSALVMAALGAAAVWAGGVIFAAMVAALVGVMVWELARMLDADAPTARPIMAGITAAVALFVFEYRLEGGALWAALTVSALLLAWPMRGNRVLGAAYLALILFAGLGLTMLRLELGGIWVLWLVLVVIASDIAGYFAGRLLGGPKLWPRVSPKKTWSGTVAGWICAGLVGVAFMGVLQANIIFVGISVLVAIAGQAGDIAESAIKRHAGVKDSSNLIPGHGGPMDRFDALIASALMVLLLTKSGVMAWATTPIWML
jgi:phosphatidate cytidylyltransferase